MPAFSVESAQVLVEPLDRWELVVVRLDDLERAGSWRAGELHRILLDEFKIDEELRIVNIDQQILRLHRRLEWQGEIERQRVVLEVEPVFGGIGEDVFFARPFDVGKIEEAVLLQRLDIFLGECRQLFAGELTLGLLLQALDGIGREHVVECPGVADAGDRAIRRVHQFGLHGHPHMRMRERRRSDEAEQHHIERT